MKLVRTLNANMAKSFVEIINDSHLEINKYSRGHIEFIANKYESIEKSSNKNQEEQKALLIQYSEEQFEILSQTIKNMESLLSSSIPNFKELFGKTDPVAPLQSN